MAFKACENCGCRIYALGCVNCDEANYIEQQAYFDSLPDEYNRADPSEANAVVRGEEQGR